MVLVNLKLASTGETISINPRQVISVDPTGSNYETQVITSVVHLTDKRILLVEGSQSVVAASISKAAA